MRFRARLAVRAAKLVSRIIKLAKKGSGLTLPGKVALRIDPDILSELAGTVREKIYVTMGTNGKTTTNAILYAALTAQGKTAVINRTGSNMMNGIVSAFVLAADKNCRIDADYACIEVDENASKYVLPKLKPDCIILTNIFRDQLDRFGEVDLTTETVKNSIAQVPEAVLVTNCDDVLSYSIALDLPNKYVSFGISQQFFDDKARSEIKESIFCRKCSTKLDYKFFHYGQLGIYSCPNCGFKREEPEYTAEDIEYKDQTYSFTIGGMRIASHARTPYSVYNTLAVYTAMAALDIPRDRFKEAIEGFDYGNGREDVFNINGARVQLHLAKNPIGFQQKVSLVLKDEKPKDIIVLINDNDQDGTDVSWLWDVDFQYLADANTRTICTTGIRRYDMALRFKYDDIACQVVADLKKAVEELTVKGTKNLYIIVNYTALYSTNQMLHEMAEAAKGAESVPDSPRDTEKVMLEGSDISTPGIKSIGSRSLTIGHLYPDLLNLYGDRGNLQCLRKRLEWRGMRAEVIPFQSGDEIDFDQLDIVLLGGGSDREQEIVCGYLQEIKEDFKAYVENGGTVIAVCGGYQLLGHYYKTPDARIEGLGILDFYTEWEPKRLVGNIVLKNERYGMPVVGFENHGGRTYSESCEHFGKVLSGYGDTENSGYEGAVYKNVIATYLHGPLLPKNPDVCDDILSRALKKKFGGDAQLEPLPDETEKRANELMVKKYAAV